MILCVPLVNIGDGGPPMDLPPGFTIERAQRCIERAAEEERRRAVMRIRYLAQAGYERRKILREMGARWHHLVDQVLTDLKGTP